MKPIRRILLCSVTLSPLAAGFAACGDGNGSSPASVPAAVANGGSETTAAAAPAQALFNSLCVTCHGDAGHGDGPGAASLDPKPRSFADAAWQDSVTDDHIHKVIVYGGAAVGKSPMMPGQPQFKGQTALLNGLTKVVRGFRGK